jgi:VanZ family protein
MGVVNFPTPSNWLVALRLSLLGGLYLTVVVAGLTPAAGPSTSGGFDYYLHALVFGCLTIVTFAAFPVTWMVVCIVFVTSVLLEVGQMLVPERSASWGDVAANGVGIAIGMLAILLWRAARARDVARKKNN